ncbi:hypothetical protein [Hoeflea prorocentri]|uniref:Uncharacterized protein n=1 Tax=Hoeflea prorocentri TaxID=1922333 RepID=A0A9X3UKA0_9HYPH|nr:hypothetical protein [Hoeflea prorocentri]MCY6380689.1 hypothetical protein [Hoeflea prorocentri]MDA5398489.1 hypothetical protein [Hoeflea prorocentri]
MVTSETRPQPHLPEQFQKILLLVGQMNYSWTNTETLLIHLIAGLAGIDKETAIVIFLTLNTTRARLDLVDRLAKMERTEPQARKDILGLTGDMVKVLKHKNRYNHCLYSFDDEGRNAKTILMRIAETKNAIKIGKTQALDASEIGKIRESIRTIETINRRTWSTIMKFDFPL